MTTSLTASQVSASGTHMPWGIPAIGGAVTAFVGLLLIFNIGAAVATLVVITGIGLMLSGISELVFAGERSAGNWIAAAVLVFGGIVVLAWPEMTLWALALVAGSSLFLAGAGRAFMTLVGNSGGGVWSVIGGIITAIVGIAAIAWPGATVAVLALMFGIRMLTAGLLMMVAANELRRVA